MDATLQDPLVGRLLDGRYLVESRIARGGMATVYLAVDRRLDREIALKVMHPHLADDDEFVSRFVREARSAARLSHPNVVQVFDQGADGDVLYLAMEHLAGRTLRDVLADRGVLTPREALTVLEPLLDALSAAHRAGIVHRDIKPENVILTDEGRVKVADFGLARAVTGGPTQTGALIGTVAYLSPELVTRGIADARSDVYAAGIMVFEMLTGRQPFVGEVPMQIAYRHVHEDVPPPSTLVPGLPTELDDLVQVATARDPDHRPVDAAHWLRLVRAVRAELTDEVLDTRPHVAAQHSPDGGSGNSGRDGRDGRDGSDVGTRTEIMAPPVRQHPTAALPALAGLQRLRDRSQREAAEEARGADAVPSPRGVRTSPEDAELDELSQRRRRRGQIAVAAIFVVTFVLGLGAWWFAAGPGAFASTPSLIALTQTEVGPVLAKQGLRGSVQDPEYSDTVEPGHVVRTDPAPGARVRNGGTVRYWLSLGTAKREVPDVIGKSRDDAAAALADKDLTVGATPQQYDPDVPAGQVIESRPGPGDTARAGGTVDLVLSKGPEPVEVPRLIGQNVDDAKAALDRLGLDLDGSEEFSKTIEAGVVIRQSPQGGTLVPGQSVKVVISKGPELVQVPDVFGKQYGEAKAQLEQMGFSVKRNAFLDGAFGTVRAQQPRAGAMVEPGTTITLLVV